MGDLTWQKVAGILSIILITSGGLTYTDLFGSLFQLKGIEANYTEDIICGIECESYINVSTSYWRVCFAHYNNTRYENKTTLFKKVSRSRTLHVNLDNINNIINTEPQVKVDWLVPARGKDNWRDIKDGDCWDRGKNNKIKLVGHKRESQTVKWGFVLEEYVNIDPIWYGKDDKKETIKCTPSTKTICKEGVCTLSLHSGIQRIYEDNIWKNIKDARSLKGSGIDCVINSDEDNLVKCIDWNLTSIQLELSQKSVSIMNKQVPIKLYKQEYNQETNEIDLVLKSNIKKNFNTLSNKKEIILSNFRYGDIIHFGEHSTTIKLQSADTENLEDSYVKESSGDSNYGTSETLCMCRGTTNARRIYIKFNLSSIPSGSTIGNSTFAIYTGSTGVLNGQVFVHHVLNYTWVEDTITWNNQPCGINFDSSTNCNLTAESSVADIDGDPKWNYFSVNQSVNRSYDTSKDNVSFILKTAESDSCLSATFLMSKEYTDDTTKRPYLNISYTISAGDTCSCPTINTNWEIDLSDNCAIDSACDIGTGNITFINTGVIRFNADITAYSIGRLPADQKGYVDDGVNIRVG